MNKIKIILAARVIFYLYASLFTFAGSVFAENFASASFVFEIPAHFCVLAKSSETSDEVSEETLAALEAFFRTKCAMLSQAMEDPFSNTGREQWKSSRKEGAVLGFWIRGKMGGDDFLIRGFDLSSLVEWGRQKASTTAINRNSLQASLPSIVTDLMAEFPFQGIVYNRSFFSWAQAGQSILVERGGEKRHPFIPVILEFFSKKAGTFVLSEDDGGKIILKTSDTKPEYLKKRLWIIK